MTDFFIFKVSFNKYRFGKNLELLNIVRRRLWCNITFSKFVERAKKSGVL